MDGHDEILFLIISRKNTQLKDLVDDSLSEWYGSGYNDAIKYFYDKLKDGEDILKIDIKKGYKP